MFLTPRPFALAGLAAIAAASGLTACDELPASALSGYRTTLAPNKAGDRLQGSWSTACTGSSPSTKTTLLFFGRQLSYLKRQFDDSVCGKAQFTLTLGKSFSLSGDENATTQALGTISRVNQMAVSIGYGPVANTATLCGLVNWPTSATAAVSVDVSGRTCLALTAPALQATGTDAVVFTGDSALTYNSVTFTKDP